MTEFLYQKATLRNLCQSEAKLSYFCMNHLVILLRYRL